MNVDRLILGLAAPFGERSRCGAYLFERAHLARFVELESGLPVLLSHEPTITARGGVLTDHGRARFAMLDAGHDPVPPGLLTLAEIDETPMGDGILAAIRRGLLDPWAAHSLTGLSLGVTLVGDDCGPGLMAWPTELSITYTPRFEGARICALGPAALAAWSLLTATPTAAGRR